MENLLLTASLVIPVFLIVGIGFLLKKLKIINDNFVTVSSKIVFSVSLPALIFVEVSKISLNEVFDLKIIIFVYAGVLISFLISWLVSNPLTESGKDKGVFIQGSFRGNFAIIGLALIANIFGTDKLGKASIILAFLIPLYNVLSVIALTVPLRKEKELSLIKLFVEILKNPLILAVIFSLPFSYFNLPVPNIIQKTTDYLAALSLPLALIGIGGFMNFSEIKKASVTAFYSTSLKLILFPLIVTFAAIKFSFIGDDLGIIFILFGCPTAIASFIMAEAMGTNGKLAGNIVLITTLSSIITITLGVFILRQNGLL